MKNFSTLPVALDSALVEVENYLISRDMNNPWRREPFYKILDINELPCLNKTLSNVGLTLNAVNIYSILYVQVASLFENPYIIIPFQNFSNMNLAIHDLKETAKANYLENGWPYYMLSQTTCKERVPFDENTMYLMNASVYHSFQYSKFPESRDKFGSYLTVGVNEDLSSYFTE